jgi:integrase/recombinase XerD
MSDRIATLPTFTTATREEIAAAAFLSSYRGETRKLYTADLRIYFQWCRDVGIAPLEAERPHLEFFARHLEDDRGNMPASVSRRLHTLRSFYRIAVADGYMAKDPTAMLRMPKVIHDETRTLGLDRVQLGTLIQTARRASPDQETLVTLMGLLGLRVSEACNVRIEDFQDVERGHRVLRVWGKGNKPATMPLPIPVLRTMEKATGDRTSGYLIRRANGEKQDRGGAYHWIKQLARKAGLPAAVHPHTLRHAAITAALDAGVPLRDAQVFARHSDPRITTRYDRTRLNLDRHAAYIVAGFIAGAA